MKIGLYGGTFDPIHHGHLILARAAKEQFGLEKIVFIPAAISPHKLQSAPTSPQIRYEMLQSCIANEPGFSADDLELKRKGPSYTFDTVMEYARKYPAAEIFYLIGADNLPALDSWYRIEELQKLVTFVVCNRGDQSTPEFYHCLNCRLDISATDIRTRAAKGLSIRYLVPETVRQIIHERQLYTNSATNNPLAFDPKADCQ